MTRIIFLQITAENCPQGSESEIHAELEVRKTYEVRKLMLLQAIFED